MSLKWKKWMAGLLAAAMMLTESPLAMAAANTEATDSVYAVTVKSVKDVTGKEAVFNYGTWGYNIGKNASGNLVMTTENKKASTPNTVINTMGKDKVAELLDSVYAVSGNSYVSGGNTKPTTPTTPTTPTKPTTSGNNTGVERPVMSYLWNFSIGRSDGTSVTALFSSAVWNTYNFVQSIFNLDGTDAKTDSKGYLAPGEYIARFTSGTASTDVKFLVKDPNVDFNITKHPADMTVSVNQAVTFKVETSASNLYYQWQKSSDGGKTWANSSSSTAQTPVLSLQPTITYNGLMFRCVVRNAKGGQLISNVAKLTVNAPAGPALESLTKTVSCVSGQTVSLEVDATGTGLKYQWQKSTDGGKTWANSSSTGAKTSKLTMTVKDSYDGMLFRCLITDSYGRKLTAGPMTLTVKSAITIESASNIANTTEGEKARFSVEAKGSNLKYQWQKSTDGGNTWVNSSSTGAATATVTFVTKASYNGWKYRCVITDAMGNKATAGPFTLTVKSKPVTAVTTQPTNVTVKSGETAVFTTAATGEGLKYQWKKSTDGGKTWVNSSSTGAKTASLSMTTKDSFNGFKFRCVITDASGKTVTTNTVTLTVTPKPVITINGQPSDATVTAGNAVGFVVIATGEELTYQWQKSIDGGKTWVRSSSTGATSAALTMMTKKAYSGYQFRCKITDKNGTSVTSNTVTLTVQ